MPTYKVIYTDQSSKVHEKVTTVKQEAENVYTAAITLNYNAEVWVQQDRNEDWNKSNLFEGPQFLTG